MSGGRGKPKGVNAFQLVIDFTEAADAMFTKLTGKTIASWLNEYRQQFQELPPGEKAGPAQPVMPLADAYAVLGLPPTASLEEVKRNYKRLAAVFHPDKGGYKEAMVLLNQAYERIRREKKGG